MTAADPVLRVATPEDADAVEALMKDSAAALFPRFYDERQSASGVRYVAEVDPMLLDDGTYFVLESDGELVACGGWSRRDKLYTGSGDSGGRRAAARPRDRAGARAGDVRPRRLDAPRPRAADHRGVRGRRAREGFRQLALVATLPGLPLYLACGFERLEDVESLPDGVVIAGVAMEKPIA